MKFVNAFFIGLLFVLAAIFTLFVGLKNHYFDFYGINEYFNVVFVDSVPWWAVLLAAPIAGYLILHSKFRKFMRIFYAAALLVCAATWHENIGKIVGEAIFMSAQKTIKFASDSNATITGRELYEGRAAVYFLIDDTRKTVLISR